MNRKKVFFISNFALLLMFCFVQIGCNSKKSDSGASQTSEESIDCFTDSRDGNVYKIVKIGDQTWMAENLKYLPSVVGPEVSSETEPYYYVYGYNGDNVKDAKAIENYATYGVLYNWSAAENACPKGWHLPSDEEWTQLTDFLGGENVAYGKLKEVGTAHWNESDESITNESGFTALPAGWRGRSGRYGCFNDIGEHGSWWSSTEDDSDGAWIRIMYSDDNYIDRRDSGKSLGTSVRCVRNN
ncbi:MAG TPA: FISUMP domain-containing protein [Bacteroidales bacterium]|nr:FISUMP domain-containing protein [Bacteroidales bacterium]HQB21255.1 FISUMP domain-containing protein [Bacteroidales bacterium]